MADEQQTTGQQRQQDVFSRQGQESQAEREQSGQPAFQSPETMTQEPELGERSGGGQPIGGNDSNTGTGTTLSQGFEPSSASNQDTSGEDRQGGGFMAAQGSGSDDYLRESSNPELAAEDSLDQQNDGGMGSPAGDEADTNA